MNASVPVTLSMHQGQPMPCPVCQSPLSLFQFNGVEVDICHTHGCGIWFDAGEAKALQERASLESIDAAFAGELEEARATSVQAQLAEAPRHNPRSGEPLERYEWNIGSGIVLDRCPKTGGIWMDRGEIEGYAKYVKRFHQSPTQLSPELSAKLMNAELETAQKFDGALDSVTNGTIKWDAGLVDDMLRGLIKGVVKPFIR